MIHTDGRPTIASYGSPLDTVRSGAVETVADIQPTRECVLLDRHDSVARVQLVLLGDNLTVRIIEAQDSHDERVLIGPVPGDKALDAFEHPYLYVRNA